MKTTHRPAPLRGVRPGAAQWLAGRVRSLLSPDDRMDRDTRRELFGRDYGPDAGLPGGASGRFPDNSGIQYYW
ncbi:MAG TPA: hypothetical protein PKA10_15585 [Selenomonadales bacterium]|nr:hypothetical protein [Selenomonadales bacterium]